MRAKGRRSEWALGLLGALWAWAAFAAPGAAPAAERIRIGVGGPITGDQAAFGEQLRNGALLAVEAWNARGGVRIGGKTYTVELLQGDDQRDPRQGVAVAHKFVNAGVVGVVGHFNSSVSIPASTVYEDGEVIQITPASTNPQFTDRGLRMVFRVCGRDDQQGRVAADFILDRLKKRKVAVLHDKTTYGQGLADEVVRFLKKRGVEPVFYSGIVQGDKDYTAVLTAARSRSPEVLYFGGIYPEAILMVRQSRALGMETVFVSGDGVWVPEFIQVGGRAAEGAYLSFTPDQSKIPAAKRVMEAHKKRFNHDAGAYTVYSYVAADIILKAVQATGSTKGRVLSGYIRQTPFDTALGRIEFDKKGDVLRSPYVFWQVRGGKFVQVE